MSYTEYFNKTLDILGNLDIETWILYDSGTWSLVDTYVEVTGKSMREL